MSWTGRNNQCWRVNTPEQVGPGAYHLGSNRAQKTSTAPFDSAEPRLNTSISQSSPGYYLGHKSWASKSNSSSSFGSKAPRIATTKDLNPGPGTYNTVSNNYQKLTYEKHFPIQIEVYRTAPSIPTKEVRPYSLGPGSYDPGYLENKPASRGTVFGAYVAKREVFEGINDNTVGPGQYFTTVEDKTKLTWMFNSSAKKVTNEKIVKNEAPGPGSYEIAGNHQIKDANVGFGSNTKRNIPMSADPHRPFISASSKSPPVGSYLSKEEQEKIENLKRKLITADYPVEKAPFGTSDQRGQIVISETPGPGQYEPVIDKSNKGLLPGKSPRFGKKKSSTPGPGAYEPLIPGSQHTQKFTAHSPRFQKEPIKPSQLQFSYEKHKPWTTKQTRSPDYLYIDKNLSFDSTGIRFTRGKSIGPGPGQYDVRSQSVTLKNSKFGGNRSSVHGDYRPKTGTSLNIGPGAYEINEHSKRTFNMAKELGKNNVWL